MIKTGYQASVQLTRITMWWSQLPTTWWCLGN